MTSKRLFFKVMREDLRHRSWMFALAALLSFLALPVVWMMIISNYENYTGHQAMELKDFSMLLANVKEFWTAFASVLGGLVAIVGALVAALAGFRFLFHKNQVDNWHSMPVKRDILFWAFWLDGVVVWLLPLFLAALLTGVLSGGLVARTKFGTMGHFFELMGVSCKTFCMWALVFFLTYNLVLTAMMLCGNVLSTLVSAGIMGFGAIGIYGLLLVLYENYFRTCYIVSNRGFRGATYVSPLFSAPMIIYSWVSDSGLALRPLLLANGLVAAVLGVCAWLLYKRRPSELAEQGVQSKFFSTVARLVTATAVGVAGWICFVAVTEGKTVWGVFGGVLAGVLAQGILDVIFRMEFKAFFAHKLQMAGVVAVSLLICLAFRFDWFGYDEYLPDKDKIVQIGVHTHTLTNDSNYRNLATRKPLDEMAYCDRDTLYAFLEKVAKHGSGDRSEGMEVCVTLENGRSYYRRYYIGKEDVDLLLPIVTSEEYLKYAYLLDENIIEDHRLTVRGANLTFDREQFLKLFAAYNQDVLECPETVILGEGRILNKIELQYVSDAGRWEKIYLYIYDSMERTIGALKSMGYGDYVADWDASEVSAITLSLGGYGYESAEDIINAARKRYGVYGESGEDSSGQGSYDLILRDEPMVYEQSSAELVSEKERHEDFALNITDREEKEELLSIISSDYDWMGNGVFKRDIIDIEMTDREGDPIYAYIWSGDLPEKYILRFGELWAE